MSRVRAPSVAQLFFALMTAIYALILGIAQGLTEFFPISSSLHLRLLSDYLQVEHNPPFFLLCHLATSFSVLLYFRKEIFLLLTKKREILLYLIALIPLVFVYGLFGKSIKGLSDVFLGPLLIVTAFLLLFLKEKKREASKFSKKIQDVLFIGSMQSLALMPGLSRSAATIFAATNRGWSMREAFCFSYLLSIPTIWGGCVLEYKHLSESRLDLPILLALLSAFIVGYIALQFVGFLIERKKFSYFGYYCLILGTILSSYSLIKGIS